MFICFGAKSIYVNQLSGGTVTMTFSILAFDERTGEIGCAAATGNLAVGAWVLRSHASVGAVASQGLAVSTLWSERAMHRLSQREAPQRIVDDIVHEDRGCEYRQLLVMNAEGQSAGWTGRHNKNYKSHDALDAIAVAGNWLQSEEVLDALKHTFIAEQGPMAERLVEALAGAASAGGDARGLMSAALQVVSTGTPPMDLRIDYSSTPIADLRSLYQRTAVPEYTAFLSQLPTMNEPHRR